MLNDIDKDNILDDFAMKSPLKAETLQSYVKRYPELALELTDLYHELLLVDLYTKTDELKSIAKPLGEMPLQDEDSVIRALSGSNLRELAKKLELPRDYISGFRDRKIRLGSIPGTLLTNLARSANVNTHQMIKHFQDITGPIPQKAYKADVKPQVSKAVEYDEFVKGLSLNESELKALNKLSVKDESS